MDKSELVKKLEADSKDVRFVPFGYKTGEQSTKELEKNPFFIALAGEEGAEKLAESSGNYKLKPYLYSFKKIDEFKTRVASLGDLRVCDDCGLGVGGGSDVGRDRRAFGVFNETGEASPQKIK